MPSAIDKFKQFMGRLLGVVAGTSSSSSIEGTAEQLRNKALAQFTLAVVFVSIAVWQSYLFGALGYLLIVAALLYSVPFVMQGIKLWKSAPPTVNGAKSEKAATPMAQRAKSRQARNSPATRYSTAKGARREKSTSSTAKRTTEENTVAQLFRDLEQQGWKIEYSLPLPDLGNVDAFLRSPNNNYFIVMVQSYRGEVFFDEGVLKRREGMKVYDFDQDFLKLVMEQALAVKDMKRLQSVTPVLCFTDAIVSIETVNNKARDVYVVKKESLVRKLARLDN
jgi:hypothetical protein